MFCITSAVFVLGAYKPGPPALFCSLLKAYSFWTCHVSILHILHWMNGSRHNKNANRQTDRCTEIPAFIREKNMCRPLPLKLRIFDVDLYRSLQNGIWELGLVRIPFFKLRYISTSNIRSFGGRGLHIFFSLIHIYSIYVHIHPWLSFNL